MTFKEKLKMEHPERVNTCYTGGCSGCPDSYGYEKCSDYCRVRDGMPRRPSDERCTACWNRTIPGSVKDGFSTKVLIIDEMHSAKTPVNVWEQKLIDRAIELATPAFKLEPKWTAVWPKKNPHLTEHAKAKINEKIVLDPREVDVLDQLMGKSTFDYIKDDLGNAYDLQKFIYKMSLNSIYGAPKVYIPDIKKVIFNDPATIVIWADGEKTVVKCQNGEPYDPEKGLAMAITKRALGNKGNYFDEIKKWTKEYDVKCAYPEIVEIHMDETESNKLEELVQSMVKRRKIGRDEV